jgi:hypothetical protein
VAIAGKRDLSPMRFDRIKQPPQARKETAMDGLETVDSTEYQRLRAMALRLIEQANRYFVMDFLEDAVVAFGDDPDPAAWRPYVHVTGARNGQWFYWRDPSDADRVHVDQVEVKQGRITVKYGGGLMDYTECQPCRFPPDVAAALARLAASGTSAWG